MPLDTAPPPAIVITRTEKHDVRAEAIEHVARQLCLADGCDPDADIRCGPMSGLLYSCTLQGLQYPANLAWNAYRDRAEAMLREVFK